MKERMEERTKKNMERSKGTTGTLMKLPVFASFSPDSFCSTSDWVYLGIDENYRAYETCGDYTPYSSVREVAA